MTDVATGKDATRKLAGHVSGLRYEQLPSALVEMAKQCVLDTLGVCIGASTLAPEAQVVADYVREFGGKAESSVLGFGGRAPAPWAVFVNGSLGHMLDYDDVGGGHVSIATIPVALALGERRGRLSGRELITAFAAGSDLMTRFCLAIDVPDWQMNSGWFATQLFGFLGCGPGVQRFLVQPGVLDGDSELIGERLQAQKMLPRTMFDPIRVEIKQANEAAAEPDRQDHP